VGAAAPEGLSRRGRAWIAVAAILGVAAILFEVFLRTDTQTFRARSGAMEPTIDEGDRFTVNKDAYDDAAPQRRDVVVVYPPQGAVEEPECARTPPPAQMCDRPRGGAADVTFVKRIVALPGERVSIVDGRAVVDGRPLDEPYARRCDDAPACQYSRPMTVPDGHYLLLGDNRGASHDGRFWGPVPREQILGRVDDCLPLGLRCAEDDRTG
jgi:signal peptidase I